MTIIHRFQVIVAGLFMLTTFLTQADKILVLVPGFGFHPQRTQILVESLKKVLSSGIDCFCMIFNYEDYVDKVQKGDSPSHEYRDYINTTCELVDYHYGNYATYMKSVPVAFLRQSGYSHVFVLLDDVELDIFDLRDLLQIMTRNNLSMISPLVGKILLCDYFVLLTLVVRACSSVFNEIHWSTA